MIYYEKPQSINFQVNKIPIYGNLILSPMDGYSDQPFRSLARELGSAMSYTEFINALDVLHGHPFLEQRLAFLESERPVVYQIFDDEPDRLLEAALRLQDRRPDIIDINMGCSAKTVSGRGAGAALLCSPRKIARIFSSLSQALDIPVTGKIRLGWDDDSRNYLEVARIIEENGGKLLAVHGRTKKQGYTGQADWDAIAEIKQAVRIPVVGNGDIRRVEDIQRMLSYTQCDAVMIARAAIGNPWIFSCLDREQVSPQRVFTLVQEHLQRMLAFYGPEIGLILFRKHASRYVSPYPAAADNRERLLTSRSPDEFEEILKEIVALS